VSPALPPYSFSDWCIRNVIWLADTNYRIDLENDVVRSLARQRASLTHFLLRTRFELAIYSRVTLTLPQLKQVTDAGITFPGYEEGPLMFRPTYRYDIGTDTYDASEKCAFRLGQVRHDVPRTQNNIVVKPPIQIVSCTRGLWISSCTVVQSLKVPTTDRCSRCSERWCGSWIEPNGTRWRGCSWRM
jgi:hypothetical protein